MITGLQMTLAKSNTAAQRNTPAVLAVIHARKCAFKSEAGF
jgi:hypothetical protein